jgi:hypothetical protein
MKEYKIIENIPNLNACEDEMNHWSAQGWRVVSFGQFQILLEKDEEDEIKTAGQING